MFLLLWNFSVVLSHCKVHTVNIHLESSKESGHAVTVVKETETDITCNCLPLKKVKANPSSFTQKAELAMSIKIILGPIQVSTTCCEWMGFKWTEEFPMRQNKKEKDFSFTYPQSHLAIFK